MKTIFPTLKFDRFARMCIDQAMEKKSRCPNFTYTECILLLELVEKNKDILNNKKTDGANLKLKESTWESVAYEFNENNHNGHIRGTKELKLKYENLKKIVKKKILSKFKMSEERSDENRHNFIMNPIELKMKDILEDELNSILEEGRRISESFGAEKGDFMLIHDIIQEHDYTEMEQEVNTLPGTPESDDGSNRELAQALNSLTEDNTKSSIRIKPLQKLVFIRADDPKETVNRTLNNSKPVKVCQKTPVPNKKTQQKTADDQEKPCENVEQAKLELINIQVNIAREELKMQQRKREQMEEEHKLKIQILQAELRAKLRKC